MSYCNQHRGLAPRDVLAGRCLVCDLVDGDKQTVALKARAEKAEAALVALVATAASGDPEARGITEVRFAGAGSVFVDEPLGSVRSRLTRRIV